MKKIVFSVLVLVVVLTGVLVLSSKKINLKNYVQVTAKEPVMNENLEIESPLYDISIDIESLQAEAKVSNVSFDEHISETLKDASFTVNDTLEDDYQWTDKKFKVKLVDKEFLKNSGLKWNGSYKFETESDVYQAALEDFDSKQQQLQTKIDNLPQLEPYIEIADILNIKYQENSDVSSAVNEDVFGFAKDVYNIDSEMYELSDVEKDFLNSEDVYYVISANSKPEGDNGKQYHGYISDNFSFIFSTTFTGNFMCMDGCENDTYEGLYVENVDAKTSGIYITYGNETKYFSREQSPNEIYEFLKSKNDRVLYTPDFEKSMSEYISSEMKDEEDSLPLRFFYNIVAGAGYDLIQNYPEYSKYMTGFVRVES